MVAVFDILQIVSLMSRRAVSKRTANYSCSSCQRETVVFFLFYFQLRLERFITL